ncbi:hypothetical protein SAMN05421684_7084 [Asanoa ishikariensis]|uniref:Uncharacterized protein n=1 Tax=Asanoa ishikariensis TaxID=137265 RepID=A0A1H3UDX5_9ACTN|nr:hypothetical protein SAMN05421684_7084 [Asanoa ishikariensis]
MAPGTDVRSGTLGLGLDVANGVCGGVEGGTSDVGATTSGDVATNLGVGVVDGQVVTSRATTARTAATETNAAHAGFTPRSDQDVNACAVPAERNGRIGQVKELARYAAGDAPVTRLKATLNALSDP